jgi:5'-nucleotidase (lipoprotein e(P4) family)
MIKQSNKILSEIIIMVLTVAACTSKDAASTQKPPPTYTSAPTPCEDSSLSGHIPEKLNSILWVQSSKEYQMAATQSYLLARVMLDKGIEDNNWTAAVEQSENYSHLPPAVILDVDETVLDNSAYQVRLEKAGTGWSDEIWNNWVLEMKAIAVPGAIEFVQYAQNKGVMVFYLTNRSHDHEQATRSNLINLGFPINDRIDTLLTRGEEENWVSDKINRRSLIAEQYRIILLIGDVANDFVPGTTNGSSDERNEVLDQYQEYWGEKWIVIPNPIYGDWEQSLYNFDYSLSPTQKFEIKIECLDAEE